MVLDLAGLDAPRFAVAADHVGAAVDQTEEPGHRADLNALEKAQGFKDYLDRYGATQEQLAQRLGMDRTSVSNLVNLLHLPEEVQTAVRQNQITLGHAKILKGLSNGVDTKVELAQYMEGTEWAWSDKGSLFFLADGVAGQPEWIKSGLVTKWTAIDRRTIVLTVVTYMTPSMTMGVHSMVLPGLLSPV